MLWLIGFGFNGAKYLQRLEIEIPSIHSCSILFQVTFSSNHVDLPGN